MINTPSIKVKVNNYYLTDGTDLGKFTEGYLMAVDCRPFQAIKFTVYLESGAIWSGLPIEAIYCDNFKEISLSSAPPQHLTTDVLQPFSCLEGPYDTIEYNLIKNAKLNTKLGNAHYLFTINYEGSGLASDPEQYKTHNIVVLESGQLAALPNNMIKVVDNWFSDDTIDTSNYKRSSKHYFPGG